MRPLKTALTLCSVVILTCGSSLFTAALDKSDIKADSRSPLYDLASSIMPKAQAADYVLDNFGKLAFYHSLRPLVEYAVHDFSKRLNLSGERKAIFDNYLDEVNMRENLVREITDELYKYKNRIHDQEVQRIAAKIAISKVRHAIKDGYAKASDKERRSYMRLVANNMDNVTSHMCALYMSSILPKYHDENRIYGNITHLRDFINKMSIEDLKDILRLNLAFMDYHSDRSRSIQAYAISPDEATAAINSYLSKTKKTFTLDLFKLSSAELKKASDQDICANAKSYYELILSMHDDVGANLRLRTFPN